ncbi:MAG TPA: C4-type zinc ribbon domain-containing protein [Thermoanaerobaculia bacterium]|nr:C4-type zinc ribbon domain-containing protein [Thermoanaerobaculia bacterium]
MSSVLDQLYRLQDRIQFVRDRMRERDTVPADLVEVDREFREKVEAVEKLRARLSEAEKEQRKSETEFADLKEKQKKYQAQLRSVQSSREYSAVLNEIDGVDRQIRTTEERLLALEEEIESARAELATREQNLPAETEQHEERLKDWRAAQRAINDELAAAEAEIQRLESEISPRDRSEFHRLLDKKRGLAVSRVIQIASSYSCSACHVKIRPAALQVLKAGREIVYCDSCKRILYYDQHA